MIGAALSGTAALIVPFRVLGSSMLVAVPLAILGALLLIAVAFSIVVARKFVMLSPGAITVRTLLRTRTMSLTPGVRAAWLLPARDALGVEGEEDRERLRALALVDASSGARVRFTWFGLPPAHLSTLLAHVARTTGEARIPTFENRVGQLPRDFAPALYVHERHPVGFVVVGGFVLFAAIVVGIVAAALILA